MLPYVVMEGGKFSGFIGDLWSNIQTVLGFDYNITLANDYGAMPDEKGHWAGMMGMVHRNEVDIAITDLFVTEQRIKAAHFTNPIMTVGYDNKSVQS